MSESPWDLVIDLPGLWQEISSDGQGLDNAAAAFAALPVEAREAISKAWTDVARTVPHDDKFLVATDLGLATFGSLIVIARPGTVAIELGASLEERVGKLGRRFKTEISIGEIDTFSGVGIGIVRCVPATLEPGAKHLGVTYTILNPFGPEVVSVLLTVPITVAGDALALLEDWIAAAEWQDRRAPLAESSDAAWT